MEKEMNDTDGVVVTPYEFFIKAFKKRCDEEIRSPQQQESL